MKRYAFIDAQNTASTTEQMLGFFVDWNKLCTYLRERCDVELTIDVLDYAGFDDDSKSTELLIFTGDGDFADVIERAVKEGSTVKIVSHAKIYRTKAETIQSRFSTKLRDLIARYRGTISLIDIERWKDHIKKEVTTETTTIGT